MTDLELVVNRMLDFDRNNFYFSRLTKDMQPWREVDKDGKQYLVLNFLGIDESDMDLKVEPTNEPWYPFKLTVCGKTHNDLLNTDYSTNMTFRLAKEPKDILYTLKDGLLTLEITYQEPVKPSVNISKK